MEKLSRAFVSTGRHIRNAAAGQPGDKGAQRRETESLGTELQVGRYVLLEL